MMPLLRQRLVSITNLPIYQITQLPNPPETVPLRSSLFKRHVHQQLVAFDIDHVAEGAVATTGKVQSHTAAAHAHIADAQLIEEPRQHGVYDVQFSALRAWPDAQHRQ